MGYMCLFQPWFPQGICLGVGLLGHMVVLFPFFLRNLHTIFHSGCISLHSHQHCKSVSFSQQPVLLLLFMDLLVMALLTTVRWYLTVVLICISLIMRDAEHLFMSLLAIWMSSLEKCLFRSFSTFWLGCLFFWYWVVCTVLIFWKLILCQLFQLLLFSSILRVVFSSCL